MFDKFFILFALSFFSLNCFSQSVVQDKKHIQSFYSTKVLFKKPKLVFSNDKDKMYTPYYVDYVYQTDECSIKYNKNKSDLSPEMVKFGIYHELSHCVLFQEATIFKNNKEIYHLLIADSLNYQQDRKIGYFYFHELYADALAAAIILKETGDVKFIKKIISWRNESFVGNHQSQEVLNHVISVNWSKMSIKKIKEETMKISEAHFMNTWVNQHFKDEVKNNSLREITLSLAGTFWDGYKYQMLEEEKLFYKQRLQDLSSNMKNQEYFFLQTLFEFKDAQSKKEFITKVSQKMNW